MSYNLRNDDFLVIRGDHMRIVTYKFYLQEDVVYDDLLLSQLQSGLDRCCDNKKTGITIEHTPENKFGKFSAVIYMLGKTEDENKLLKEKVEDYLKKKGWKYQVFNTFLLVDEERIYIELETV